MEAGPPLGYTFPTPKAGFRTGVRGSPSTSLTGCESSFGAELLCAHLSPRPGSPALPLSKLGLGFIPWLLQLEWKSALVCQPCTQSLAVAQHCPHGDIDPCWQLLMEPPEGRCWDRHQEFLSIPSLPVPRGTLTLLGPHLTSHWGMEPSPCSSHHHPTQLCTSGTKISGVQPEPPRPRLLLARGELGSAPR